MHAEPVNQTPTYFHQPWEQEKAAPFIDQSLAKAVARSYAKELLNEWDHYEQRTRRSIGRNDTPNRKVKNHRQLRERQSLLDKLLGNQGMKLLFAVAWPPQGIYTKKEIGSVADLRGIKWRAYSPATAKIAELIGAQPVTIQAAELSQALATGVVESYMSSGSTGFDTKTYESLKYFYDTQAWLPKNAVIVNKKAYDALDPATQAALNKAAAEAETRGWKVSEEKDVFYKKALTEKGMKIMTPSPKLMADMKQVGAVMLADWQKKAGAEGDAIITAFNKSAPAAKANAFRPRRFRSGSPASPWPTFWR
ncbi:MAG: hypothetical protein RL492_1797, partial [Verrucomicrobiota bacterium]